MDVQQVYRTLLKGKPFRQIMASDMRMFYPAIIPDAIARGFVIEQGCPTPGEGGGKDMFGVDWEYDSRIGGSTVRPGTPLFSDANDWEAKVIWPDICGWNWAGCAERNRDFLSPEQFNVMPMMTGWFERLVSMMDFENALIALVDEDQKAAVQAFFHRLTDTYIELLERAIDVFPELNGFWIHDDWGSARNSFFSPEVCQEMIVPHMRRVTDFLHQKGKYCEFHSCGMIHIQIPNIIRAGWDAWVPQDINDTREIYRRYGSELLIGVAYPWPAGASEPEQADAVHRFREEFGCVEKPCILNDIEQPNLSDFIRRKLCEPCEAF